MPTTGRAGGSPGTTAPTHVARGLDRPGHLGRLRVGQVLLVVGGAGGEQPLERTVDDGQLLAQALLDDPAVVEDGDHLGPLDRAQAVGDQDAGASTDQPVGRGDDPALGDRVHPGGGLVEHDHLDVADQQAGERDELLLARRQRRAARAEQRVEPARQSLDPLGEPELLDGRLDLLAGNRGEQGDVLRQGPGEDLGALGDHADAAAQLVQVEGGDVRPAEEDRAGGRLDGAREQRRERRLARAGATDERDGVARLDVHLDVLEGERTLGVGEVEVADAQVERAGRDVLSPDGLGLDGEELAQAQDRTEAGLDVGQLVGEVVDLADEDRGDEEQGHQPVDRQRALSGEQHARHGHGEQQAVQDEADLRSDPALDPHHGAEALVDQRRELCEPLHGEGLAQAGAKVVAPGDALLQRGGVVGPGHLLDDLEPGDLDERGTHHPDRDRTDDREEQERGPPGEAGDEPHRHGAEGRAHRHPDLLPQQGADLVGVVVDPVQDLPDGLLGQVLERLVERSTEQVTPQPTLRTVDDTGPHHAARRVDGGGADDAQREPADELRGGMLGHPAGEHRTERRAEGADRDGDHREERGAALEAAPVDAAGGVVGDVLRGRGGSPGQRRRHWIESSCRRRQLPPYFLRRCQPFRGRMLIAEASGPPAAWSVSGGRALIRPTRGVHRLGTDRRRIATQPSRRCRLKPQPPPTRNHP